MQIFSIQDFPFQIGKPGNMNYKYTVLGILVIAFSVIGSKSGPQPLWLPVFSFEHKTG